ncbi:phosphate ABC transporter substrate-binding protein PstS [Micromonospora echinospora]|uniref:Phosphate-binding protein n=1 Tax=Micromonospora echinospora TaxID=1877 RepID=A0A1C4WZ92_MICEC|nr:phosphate ABC transporter substrate-binding protein PstS [Micromonospora echinospora]OZV77317.1 phosphate ABC transporter substrate-binding protein PstS [Micromonospora echinospora]SCF01577.1 phosphate ABC transporter substrate-binding protein, PhoT family [Micromonospora echinospora]
MNRNVLSRRVLAGVALAALALTGCGSSDNDSDTPAAGSSSGGEYASLSGELKASGASFPDAYYQEVITSFKDVAPDVTVNYNATGSGTGKKQFGENLVDFAGSDSLVKDSDGVAAGSFLYVPTVAAPITVSYNLQGVDKLQLSPETLAKIFQTDIKTWNDPAIAADNPGVTLPNTPITVAHRSDGSGTTNNFTKYLEAAAPGVWKLGTGDTVAWPSNTQGGEKNTGVAQIVKQANGGIGYVDLSDAKASQLTFAAIKNKDGQYVVPSLEGTTAGLEGAEIKEDLSYNPLNAAGAASYPITAPTYILVKTKYDDAKKAELVKGFVKYILTDGQELAKDVDFAPLPTSLKDKALAQLDKIQG